MARQRHIASIEKALIHIKKGIKTLNGDVGSFGSKLKSRVILVSKCMICGILGWWGRGTPPPFSSKRFRVGIWC